MGRVRLKLRKVPVSVLRMWYPRCAFEICHCKEAQYRRWEKKEKCSNALTYDLGIRLRLFAEDNRLVPNQRARDVHHQFRPSARDVVFSFGDGVAVGTVVHVGE